MPSSDSESITSRYRKTAETVRKFSNVQFGNDERVKLIVVTKWQPLESCLEVIAAGATDLGENYPEESINKLAGTDLKKIDLHMIGHIQSRKIKLLNPLFQYVHSIDSLELAIKINNYCTQQDWKVNALIEVDFTSELTKSGFRVYDPHECNNFTNIFEELLRLEGLSIIGLMTMGHYPDNEETNRNIFKACRRLLSTIVDRYKIESLRELSMGTSGDYKTAIAEGATMVRVGELIMGSRSH